MGVVLSEATWAQITLTCCNRVLKFVFTFRRKWQTILIHYKWPKKPVEGNNSWLANRLAVCFSFFIRKLPRRASKATGEVDMKQLQGKLKYSPVGDFSVFTHCCKHFGLVHKSTKYHRHGCKSLHVQYFVLTVTLWGLTHTRMFRFTLGDLH